MGSRLAVLAIGGNSLIKDKNHIALSSQYEAIQETSKYIAELIAEGLSIVITHGNGPQVGFLYRRGELARRELPLIPLDICGADTQGAIGYMIEMALLNEFHKMGITKKVAAVVTKTIVDRDDPPFKILQNRSVPLCQRKKLSATRKNSGGRCWKMRVGGSGVSFPLPYRERSLNWT